MGEASADDPVTPAALIDRGMRALHDEGDLRRSRRLFEQAYRTAERDGDPRVLADAAIGVGGLWVHEHRNAAVRARMKGWQSRAVTTAVPGSDQHLLLRARLAAEADYLGGRHTAVLTVLDEARHRHDPAVLASVLSLAHHCMLGPGHGVLRAELAQELLLVASRTERRSDRLMGLLWHSVDLFLSADPHAQRSLAELAAELASGDHLAVSYVLQAVQVMLAIRAGDFDRAETMAAQCVAAGELCGDADATGWYSGQLLAIRWFQGRVAELLPMLIDQVHSPELSGVDDAHIAALAVAAAAGGDHRAATGALARLGNGDLTELPGASVWLVTVYGAVEAAAALADRDTATTAYALLKPYAKLPMTASLAVSCFGSVEHALGVASITTGHHERAIAHLRRAVRANLALEHWPAACLSRYRLAQVVELRDDPGDRAEAARERAAAEQEAFRLQMVLPGSRSRPGPQVVERPVSPGTQPHGRPSDGSVPHAPEPHGPVSDRGRRNVNAGVAVAARSAERPRLSSRSGPDPQAGSAEPAGSSGSSGPSGPAVEVREGAAARIGLLGPLEVRVAGAMRPVFGTRRRTVLAVLALHAGEMVSVDRLIDIVWGDRPPRTAINTLQSHVSYLRRMIGDQAAIHARQPGYVLDLGDDVTDVKAAEQLIQAGTRFSDPADRIRHLIAALALWRGRPLVDVSASTWLDQQAERLNHLLLQAHQALAEARLSLGENSLLTIELQPLTREHPLAERLHAHLMLALYREGRQSEALAVYRRLRSVLSAELGVEPTEPLRELQLAILRQDANLQLAID